MSNEQFQNWKIGFIINNFADNIYFQPFIKTLVIKYNRNPEPHAPKLNVWTSQPVDSIKTMKHL